MFMRRSKWIYLLGAALLALVSCIREEAPRERAHHSVEGKKVRVEFSIAGGSAEPSTKGLDNGGDITRMYVAVFGSSGFLKEYAQATLEDYDGTTTTYYTDSGETDEEGEPILIPHTVELHKFSVELTITDSPRKVHFLGNGPASLPFGYDTAVMPVQMSQLNDENQGEKAYWQMIDLPDGIQAKRDAQGNFIDKDGDRYLDDNGNVNTETFDGFVLDPGQEHYFQEIPLIRNWAKIVLYTQEGSHFTPISFSVINYPSRGAIAPYSAKTDFIRNYQDMDFPGLQAMGYPANLPAGTEFDDSKPSADAFKADPSTFVDGGRVAAALQSKAQVDAGEDTDGHAVYLYERPIPSEKIPPTYVIVYGHYSYPRHGNPGDADYDPGDPDHEGDYFYKVDLMETFRHEDTGEWESNYYPIYRNFKYQICITKILSMGHGTPESAAASAGSADVSADISTSHIADISDGVGRLHLTWMNKSYNAQVTEDHPETTLKVYFATTNGDPIGTDENPAVTAKLLPPSDGGSDIVFPAGVSKDPDNPDIFRVGAADEEGWRPIEFCTAAPSRTIRSQTLRITGNHNEGRLYRDVVITVLPTQEMRVTCEYPVLHALKGEEQTVNISIPEGLTKNLFPIEFEIEAQDLTLTPDTNKEDNNLPVVIADSISDDEGYAGKPSYHFTRTLTWDQYKAAEIVRTADGGDKTWRTIPCYFKTNCASNATKVWVESTYFEKTSASFSNFGFGLIHDGRIPVSVPAEAGGESIPFEFQVETDEHGEYPELTLRLTCLTNDSSRNTGVTRGDDVDSFLFTPTGAQNTLYFFSTTNDGEFQLEISATGYNSVVVKPYRFNKGITTRSYGLLDGVCDPLIKGTFWSNMAYGRAQTANNKNVSNDRGLIFGYYDDPDCPGATITLKDAAGNIVGSSDKSNTSGVKASTPASYPCTPDVKDASVNPYYHELQVKTVGSLKDKDIHLVLSSPGYVTETYRYPRLTGKTHIHTEYFTAKDYNLETGILQPKDNNRDKCYFHLTFTPQGDAPALVVSSNNLCLGQNADGNAVPGSRYLVKVESGDVSGISGMETYPKNQRFFCGFFKFVDGFVPASVEPESGCGTWFQYPGAKGWFEWLAYDNPNEYTRMSPSVVPETNPVKTMMVTVGDTPVRISNFTYKAISDAP